MPYFHPLILTKVCCLQLVSSVEFRKDKTNIRYFRQNKTNEKFSKDNHVKYLLLQVKIYLGWLISMSIKLDFSKALTNELLYLAACQDDNKTQIDTSVAITFQGELQEWGALFRCLKYISGIILKHYICWNINLEMFRITDNFTLTKISEITDLY